MLKNLKKYIHIITPGILVAATGVGAGDLITASFAGNKIGLAIVWAPFIGAFFKLVLTEGLVRNQIASQNLLMDNWHKYFGKTVQYFFLFYLLIWTYMVGGALINSCAAAMHAIFPIGSLNKSMTIWGVFHSLVGLAFVIKGDFKFFEKLMSLLISLMFLVVIVGSIFFIDDKASLALGLIPSVPKDNITWLIGLIGGVGGTLTILSYGYWIKEEGRNNEQGLKVCKIDLTVAYSLTAMFSVAMIILGTKLNLEGMDKSQISMALAKLFNVKFGEAGGLIFKLGFWAGVFSSLLGVWQSVPYLFANFYSLNFKRTNKDDLTKTKPYRYYLLFLSIVPITSLWVKFESIQLAYAFIGALFVPSLAVSLLILNNHKSLPKKYRNQWKSNLILSLCLIFFVGIGLSKFL